MIKIIFNYSLSQKFVKKNTYSILFNSVVPLGFNKKKVLYKMIVMIIWNYVLLNYDSTWKIVFTKCYCFFLITSEVIVSL